MNKSDKLIKLGAMCRAIREAYGLTQKDIARETFRSVSNISNFENGRINNAVILAYYLDLACVDFVEWFKENAEWLEDDEDGYNW